MVKETWKDIQDYEGHYQISNYGRVKSIKRNLIIKPFKNELGYLIVNLRKNNKEKHYRIHRLVAQAFILNSNNYLEVNHKDENKENNYVENLEWCDHKYNCSYGNRNNKIGENNAKKVNQYDLDENFIKQWNSTMEIQKNLGYSCAAISNCCKGKLKTAYKFIWKYEE